MAEWRDVIGYEGLYQVSDDGSVRSLDRVVSNKRGLYLKPSRLLKQRPDKDGYKILQLCEDNKKTLHKVHRLVAKAFLTNDDLLPTVNHINEVKNDNRVENLEWCTNTYNRQHSSILSIALVEEIVSGFKAGLTNTQLAGMYPTSHKNISCIRRGGSWTNVTKGEVF